MFVDVDDAEVWYSITLDGLRHLETALHSPRKALRLSQSTLDQIHGMSAVEWGTFRDAREAEHEMFASLAILAAFEGGIRRDAAWRGGVDSGQEHFLAFRSLSQDSHVPLSRIFETWESAFTQGHPLRRQFAKLRRLYVDRNVIAHGKARRGQFAFDLILPRLQEASRKWREFVPDFGKHA